MDKKKPCNCIKQCPCYPMCDQMMDEGQIPGTIPPSWHRAAQPAMHGNGNSAESAMDYTLQTPRPEGSIRMNTMPQPEDNDRILEEENELDWQKIKEMYPEIAKIIMTEVERVCDSMEYEGSMMFDSMPDRVRIRMLTDEIYDKVKDRYPVEETLDQDDMFVMNQESRRRYPPKQNWLGDFIQVLLFQEMFRRRCRHRGCRRW